MEILSVEEKVKIILQRGNNKMKRNPDVCRKFGLVDFKNQKICKDSTIIVWALEKRGSRNQRFRKPERCDVDKLCISGPALYRLSADRFI
jgi:hypothetical protein